jgi:hypothetical protein
MNSPIISKHIRIKVHRTPILEELLTYSRRTGRPNEVFLEKISKIWRSFPGKEQCSYNHLPDMSTDLTKYLISSNSTSLSPSQGKKNLSPIVRNSSYNRIKTNNSSKKSKWSKRFNKSRIKLSPQTKSIAINLNKHKLEEEQELLRPKYLAQALPPPLNASHKKECGCEIAEVPYSLYTVYTISQYSIFVSCKFAASNLPNLIKHNINAVLCIGNEPNFFPSIRGGYFKINIDGNSLLKPLTIAFRFLNSQLSVGNVLIECETGNTLSCITIVAYLLKETKLNYTCAYELVKQVRPCVKFTKDEEKFIRSFDQNKAGVIN